MSGLIPPDGGRVDPTPHLAAVASAMARPGQPAATYAALESWLEEARQKGTGRTDAS